MGVHWMIVRQLFRAGTGGQRYHWAGWVLMLLLVPGALAYLFKGDLKADDLRMVATLVSLGLGFALFQWIIALFSILGEHLSQPSQVCLVPGLRRRLLHIVFAAWLAFVVLVGSLYGVGLGSPLAGIFICAFLLNRIAWGFAGSPWHLAGVLAWMGAKPAALWAMLPGAQQQVLSHWSVLVGLAILLLADGLAAMRLYVAAGGDAQFGLAGKARHTAGILWRWEWERQVKLPGDVVRLDLVNKMMLGLGLYHSRRQWLEDGAILAGAILLFAFFREARTFKEHGSVIAGAAGVMILIAALAGARKVVVDVSRTAAEQQLMCLAPGIVQGAARNRVFLSLLLRQWLMKWLPALVLLLGSAIVLGVPAAAIRALAGLGLAILCIMPTLLDEDYGRLQEQAPATLGCLTIIAAGLFGPVFGLLEADLAPYTGIGLGAALAAFGLVTSRRAWRKRVHGDALLPVGSRHLFVG